MLHIGYLRYSQSIFLDYLEASAASGGAETRLGIIEAFLQLGHKVTILSKLAKKNEHILKGKGKFFDYSIFRKLRYSPDRIPSDMDLLFIENAVGNIFFASGNIARLIDIFNKYSGKVVYYHAADMLSCFPLGAMLDGERTDFQKTEKISFKNIFKGMSFEDKQYTLLTHAIPELLVKKQDTNRFRYSRFDHSIGIPMGYSPNFDRVTRVRPISKRRYDSIYIGNQKSAVRTRRLVALYGEDDCCKRILYGKWKEPLAGFDYKGEFLGHGKIYSTRVYQRGIVSVKTGDSWYTDIGMIAARGKEAARSWNLTLVDSSYVNANEIFGPDFVIHDHGGLHEWLDASDDVIMDAIKEQRRSLQPWSKLMEETLEEIGEQNG